MADAKAVADRNQVMAVAFVSSVLVILGVWFWSFASPDRLLERSYARVAPHGTLYLDDTGSDRQPTLRVTPAAALPATAPAAAHVPHTVVVVNGVTAPSGILSEPLAIGERVRIRAGNHESREVEVQEVAELEAPIVGLPGVRLQWVTARPLGVDAPNSLQLVFAIRDADPAKLVPVATSNAGRAL